MGLRDMDIEGVLHRLADRKIEQAMREGKFDRIEGAGKPLDLEPVPAEENARLRWWALRILKQNDITPEEVQWRKQAERLREELDGASDEHRVRMLVAAHNALARKLNTLGTNAMSTVASAQVAAVALDDELAKLAGRRAALAMAADAFAGGGAGDVVGMKGTSAPAAGRPPAAPTGGKAAGVLASVFGFAAARACGRAGCGTRNPGRATYCRRCGHSL
ncbi:MAG: hypothetical protein JWO31_1665 [Phycisphaerales bacterium]|nr:hypothetical protein [Phycisphaerales bacterium]